MWAGLSWVILLSARGHSRAAVNQLVCRLGPGRQRGPNRGDSSLFHGLITRWRRRPPQPEGKPRRTGTFQAGAFTPLANISSPESVWERLHKGLAAQSHDSLGAFHDKNLPQFAFLRTFVTCPETLKGKTCCQLEVLP